MHIGNVSKIDINATQMQKLKIKINIFNVNTMNDKKKKKLNECGNYGSSNVKITTKIVTRDS